MLWFYPGLTSCTVAFHRQNRVLQLKLYKAVTESKGAHIVTLRLP
jgi:hypothetical protein